ncbi:MAG TPA: CGNR zinc finger domain-containing protein [Candidatus Dormibacteraeota bacterium]|nr:CGNR zinc finger domain-containing protein [Candidatus Dormibacteraeota bacterium]
MNARENIFRSHGFGKVAPWVDLANSLEWDGFGNRSDRLDDPHWLAAFRHRWNFRPAPRERTPLAALQRLRRLLRAIAEKLGAAKPLSHAETAELNAALSVPVRQKLLQRQNGYRTELAPLRANWNWILASIAASAAQTLASEQAARIKICANHDCRWLFHDPTKARIKRWCSDRTCGNRDRVRRSRAASK